MSTSTSVNETEFEQALSAISLATWNRPRSDSEIRSLLARRHAVVDGIEL